MRIDLRFWKNEQWEKVNTKPLFSEYSQTTTYVKISHSGKNVPFICFVQSKRMQTIESKLCYSYIVNERNL